MLENQPWNGKYVILKKKRKTDYNKISPKVRPTCSVLYPYLPNCYLHDDL